MYTGSKGSKDVTSPVMLAARQYNQARNRLCDWFIIPYPIRGSHTAYIWGIDSHQICGAVLGMESAWHSMRDARPVKEVQ